MSSTKTREVDFDPSELGYKPGHRHVGVGDRDYKTYLVQIEDSPFWVCYTESLVGIHPNEYNRTVQTVGRLNIRPGDLNVDEMKCAIKANIADLREQRSDIDDDNLHTSEADIQLVEDNAEQIAKDCKKYWQRNVEEVLGDAIHDHEGHSMRKDLVWTGHVPGAFNNEVDQVFADLGIDRSKRTRENPLFWDVVREPLREQASRRGCRDCEYWGHLDFADTDQALAYIEQLLA
jgi:hypothetical protein